jgi:eukaryotic translation initiation factor 2C
MATPSKCIRCDKPLKAGARNHDIHTCSSIEPVSKINPIARLWSDFPTHSTAAHTTLLNSVAPNLSAAKLHIGEAKWPKTISPTQRIRAQDLVTAIQGGMMMFQGTGISKAICEAAVVMINTAKDADAATAKQAAKASAASSGPSGSGSGVPDRTKQTDDACGTCNSPGHPTEKCPTCEDCKRHGHTKTTCPYEGFCNNCGRAHAQSCKPGCTVAGCKLPFMTWSHPHKATAHITELQRSAIAGRNVKIKDQVAPNSPIYEKKFQGLQDNARTSNLACYNDTTLEDLGGGGRDSVVTNYVAVSKYPPKVWVYDIVYGSTVSPVPGEAGRPIQQRGQKARIFEALQRRNGVLHGQQQWSTNHKFTQLWSLIPLPGANPSKTESNVEYIKPGGSTAKVTQVVFTFNCELDLGGTIDLADVVKPTSNHDHPSLIRTALNALLTKHVTTTTNQSLEQVGDNKFFVTRSVKDIEGVHLARGYFTSVRPGADQVLLNVNVTHAAFFAPLTVSKFLDKMRGSLFIKEYGDPMKYLRGRTVRITYERDTTDNVNRNKEEFRKKTIAGFGLVPALQQFVMKGKLCTVQKYFADLGHEIFAGSMPCVNVGLARPQRDGADPDDTGALWIPAEFLELEPFQPFKKQLCVAHMQKMHSTALRHPAANHCSIVEEGLQLLGLQHPASRTKLRNDLHLQAGTGLLHMPATFLPCPTIVYAAGSIGPEAENKASWNMRGQRFKTANQHKRPLAVLDLRDLPEPQADARAPGRTKDGRAPAEPHTPKSAASAFINILRQHGVNGVEFSGSTRAQAPSAQEYQREPGIWREWLRNLMESRLQLPVKSCLLVLLDSANVPVYNAIKTYAETELGVHTICLTKDKVDHANAELWANLALKYNIKSGHTCHTVRHGQVNCFKKLEQSTMVLGADVAHNGGAIPSVAAVVGSIDNDFVNMPGSSQLQPARVEIIPEENIQKMARERLIAFAKNHNGRLPEHILYYRDGVGEDQYRQVLDVEVKAIKNAFIGLQAKYKSARDTPAFTVVVVGKRHNTRFFAPNARMTYEDNSRGGHYLSNSSGSAGMKYNGNVKPGLVVDSVITQPSKGEVHDFFLQSHRALKGTARSAHYVVLQNDDTSPLTFHDIQSLSHAFCYTFARATKGVSYCAPAYNADRLCDRVNRYIRFWMDEHQKFVSEWAKQEYELDKDHRQRICDEVTQKDMWKPVEGRPGPWTSEMDDVMFWL